MFESGYKSKLTPLAENNLSFMRSTIFSTKKLKEPAEVIKQRQSHLHFWTVLIYTLGMMILLMEEILRKQIYSTSSPNL